MTAYTRDEPSPRYRELERVYADVHSDGLAGDGISAQEVFAGSSLYDHIPAVRDLVRQTGARTVLDYGAGKGLLYRQCDVTLPDGTVAPTVQAYWGIDEIRCYDPGVPEFSALPDETFDGVVCTDVLEHIPEEDIDWFLRELFRFADRFVYANIASYPARKTLPNGWNAHVTVKEPRWWRERITAAARGWRGEAYVFQVLERKRGLEGSIRRLVGLTKWKATAIEYGTRAGGRT